jgi:hypothetical protein
VLPIRQLEADKAVYARGTGLPDQEVPLDDPGLRFGDDVPAPTVTVDGKAWHPASPSLEAAGPGCQVFMLDSDAGAVRFGNGVNGAVPRAGAALRVGFQACRGRAGNLPAGLAWGVQGLHGDYGANPEPTRGGEDRLELDDLRRLARRRLAESRPLVTADDIAGAALADPDLRVARAELISGFDRDRFGTLAKATRTLVAVRARRRSEGPPAGAEPSAWLDAWPAA